MTTARKPRIAQAHSLAGQRQQMLAAAAPPTYPPWPADLVALPRTKRERRVALDWFDRLQKHRVPENWQPGDVPRLAMLALAYARQAAQLAADRLADPAEAKAIHAAIGQLSRQLGLNAVAVDARQEANFAAARRNARDSLEATQDDLGLLARPPMAN